MTLPLAFRSDGQSLAPLPRFAAEFARAYPPGVYRMVEVEERSTVSHNHFFARVDDLWQSLPDGLATQFATPDMLRKHALIMTGFRRERKLVASSPAEARKIAAFLRPQTAEDDYAIISVNGTRIIEWKAASQSMRAMPKGEFQRSKTAVLEWIEELIGVKAEAA